MRISLFFFILFTYNLTAQENLRSFKNDWNVNDRVLDTKKRNILLYSGISSYAISLISLNYAWYQNYDRSSFHFINDNNEWLQLDKVGHAFTSYYLGVKGIQCFKWAGFNRKKSIWYGGMSGSVFLTIVEILDGTSKKWGASPGDLIANTAGSMLAILQELKTDEQSIQFKFSYFPSKWASLNPSQLGKNQMERILKDYNGQTYWLSFNLKSLLNIHDTYFPKWLALSVGYSGDNMITPSHIDSKRQFFMSFDVDLSKLKSKSKFLNSMLSAFGFIKLPAPTIEYCNPFLKFHPIYF